MAHKSPFLRKTTLDFDNINFQTNYSPMLSYGRSKLYNVLFTRALAERIKKGKGLTASLHPGVVRTELLRETIATNIVGQIFKYILNVLWLVYWFFTKSSEQGSYTTLFTLLSPDV
jgi:NAD(P)-dependent dehydrogenase (short-subunit alcohol dehydrogenase family)